MNPVRIAWFISPHGFGHAARACAVMEQLFALDHTLLFDVYTLVPEWFFTDSLSCPFTFHPHETDIGLVQTSPLHEDIPATIDRLQTFMDFSPQRLQPLVQKIVSCQTCFVISDISPLGLAVANAADVPSILIENFTWDWIYEGYIAIDSRMRYFSKEMRTIFDLADYHIQTEPVCRSSAADLVVPPVSRSPRLSVVETRMRLNIGSFVPAVLFSMTTIPVDFFEHILRYPELSFIIPAREVTSIQHHQNCILIPVNASMYHPDLVAAVNVVVGKVGYSTLAETFNAGVAYGYLPRKHFRESLPLVDFITSSMNAQALAEEDLTSGRWIDKVLPLCSNTVTPRFSRNGVFRAAEYIMNLVHSP